MGVRALSPPSPEARAHAPRFSPPTADELGALGELGAKGTWTFQGRSLSLTNLDKVLFGARDGGAPVTKRDLVRYYATIAPVMGPYLFDRPVNLQRFPDGIDRPGFWHKEAPARPDWIGRWRNDSAAEGETRWYSVIDSSPALAWMGQYAALELHPWTSSISDADQPTWALIDIDPGPRTTFAEVLVLARLYRTALEHLGLVGRPKVTGQRGVQIWVPIDAGYSFDDTRRFVETVSRAVGGTVGDLVSWSWHTRDRRGRARLDYTQNARNKTLVAPYSPRPAPGAPVSVPLEWHELDDPDLRPDGWTISTVVDRVQRRGDPFEVLLGVKQPLPEL